MKQEYDFLKAGRGKFHRPNVKLNVPVCLDEEDVTVKEFSVIIERDVEGYYVASVPGLRGCHTQAKSLDELMARIQEAVELCLEDSDDDIEPLDFVGVQKITVAP